jgi:hypothetical protein
MSIANFPDHAVVIQSRIDENNSWDFNARINPTNADNRHKN